jgi:predicted unusual protein kinase regulating ubiquinone biosynthesis (AarF/ABC1/UbiB family)
MKIELSQVFEDSKQILDAKMTNKFIYLIISLKECDYVREAECCRRMRKLLEPYPEFYVPKVIDELSTKQVFTTELISGLTIDQVPEILLRLRKLLKET